MRANQVVAHYGGHESKVAVTAQLLDVSRQTIYNWLENGVPDYWQKYIELDTKGKLRRDRRKQKPAKTAAKKPGRKK